MSSNVYLAYSYPSKNVVDADVYKFNQPVLMCISAVKVLITLYYVHK